MYTLTITLTCPICLAIHTVVVREDELNAYEAGAMAQDAFKSLSATEREQIISRICPTCQADIFGEEEEDA